MRPGTCIDTNVLVDVFFEDAQHGPRSERALDAAATRGPLLIGPVTYAELLASFAKHLGERDARHDLDLFLHEAGIEATPLDQSAATVAGLAYLRHLGSRDAAGVECAECGHRNQFQCASCRRAVVWRQHILTDFLIGAHALHTTGVLLTRDRHLRRKIPGLRVVTP